MTIAVSPTELSYEKTFREEEYGWQSYQCA